VKTPIDPSVIAQAVQGVVRNVGQWAMGWFGPGAPIEPVVGPKQEDGVRGRQFDYPVYVNTRISARDGEGVTFEQMRALADGYDFLRLIIERRKDQMSKLRWTFGLKPEIEKQKVAEERVAKAQERQDNEVKRRAAKKAKPAVPAAEGEEPVPTDDDPALDEPLPDVPEVPKEDPRIAQLRDFFAFPDQENDWETWLRMLLEDMLVIDAATLYPRMTLGGDLFSMEPVDGSTVKRLLDETGRTPIPPQPAYQQILKGLPAVDYNRDELLYKPRNKRTNKLYGMSPVEQIIMTVNIALRRQVHQLQFYTEGNVPEMLFGVPDTWNPDQIKKFQEWWDTLLAGNTAERRHAKFVPGGVKPFLTKEGALKDDMDEWLARIVCFAFSIDPTPFVKQQNRATAESSMSQALSEGLMPVMNWTKNLVDMIVWKYFGFTDLEFKWEKTDDTDPKVQSEILTSYVEKKIMTDDEAREQLGMDPKTEHQRSQEKAAMPVAPPGFGGGPDAEGQEPGKAQGAPLDKAARPKKRPKQLDRDRKGLVKPRAAVQEAFAKALSATMSAAASALRASPAEVVKASATPKQRAESIVAKVDLTAVARASAVVSSALEGGFAEGFKAAGAQVKARFDKDQLDQANERAVEWAQERSAALIKDVEDATRDMLQSHIAAAMEAGATNDEIADSLAEFYGFSEERAETIARTETAAADVQGNLDAYAESGLVDEVEWIDQGGACDICNSLAGTTAPIGGTFEGGYMVPAHPNCECDVLPVI